MHTFDLLLILGKQFEDFIELNDSLNSFVTTFFLRKLISFQNILRLFFLIIKHVGTK